MSTQSRSHGYAVAALAAAGALLCLWAPWYTFHIPQAVLSRAEALSGQFGILGPFIAQYAQAAQAMGPIDLNAWDVLHQIDVVIAIGASIAVIFALLAIAGRGRGLGPLIAGAGGLVAALAVFRVIDLPGPSEILSVAWGGYVEIACGALMVLGGILAARGDERDEKWAPDRQWAQAPAHPGGWAHQGSVPPPTG